MFISLSIFKIEHCRFYHWKTGVFALQIANFTGKFIYIRSFFFNFTKYEIYEFIKNFEFIKYEHSD